MVPNHRNHIDDVLVDTRSRGVSGRGIHGAMRNAATRPEENDRLAAAIVYTVAASIGLSAAPDVASGNIRVDAVLTSAMEPGATATYCYAPSAFCGLDHANTVYLPINFSIRNAGARAAVVHGMTHAVQDRREANAAPQMRSYRAEAEAYVAQAEYLYGEIMNQRAGPRRRQVAFQATNGLNQQLSFAMALVAARRRPALDGAFRLVHEQAGSGAQAGRLKWSDEAIQFLLGSSPVALERDLYDAARRDRGSAADMPFAMRGYEQGGLAGEAPWAFAP